MLLKSVHVVDPAAGRNGRFDVLIENGRVTRVGRDIPAGAARVVELPASVVVTPGLIDIHVHLREPGQEHKETVATGTASAPSSRFPSWSPWSVADAAGSCKRTDCGRPR